MANARATRPPETAPRKRGRPKLIPDEAQRSHIVESARELFVERGYGRTTTDDIAAHCRVSKQTLYRLFPSKQALFIAIVDAHRQSMLALPDNYDGLPLQEALEKIFTIDIDARADKERVALLRLVILESHQFPELRDILIRHGAEKSHGELTQWLAEQSRRGLVKFDHVGNAAQILMDMIFGAIIFKASADFSWPGVKQRRAYIRQCISVFLKGVVPR